jgi:hypothetical protein
MDKILDEYVNITIKIRDIQNGIYDYKKNIETKLAREKNRKKRIMILKRYKNFIDKIKNSETINNYKSLKEKQTILKNKLLSNNNEVLDKLKNKYENLTKKNIVFVNNSIENDVRNILSS